jgi:hypothetical protein
MASEPSHRITVLEYLAAERRAETKSESYDRGVKLPNYRTIPEVAEILYFAQDRCLVEHWTRQDGEEWLVKITQDLKAIIALPSIGCSLPLATVYRRVLA